MTPPLQSGASPMQPGALQSTQLQSGAVLAGSASTGHIRHVIIVVQENRTPDNLFYRLPGADTVGPEPVRPVSLTWKHDLQHTHPAFVENFKNGFSDRAHGYVPRSEAEPYFDMARRYAFADRMFQTNEGPSFPAHQYLISGTSTLAPGSDLRVSENARSRGHEPKYAGGCDSTPETTVKLIDLQGNENQEAFPCFERQTLGDLLAAKGLSWKYYQSFVGPGIWAAFDAIKHIAKGPAYPSHVGYPPSSVLVDIEDGNLATVSWVTPTPQSSDHAGDTDGTGPSWVASIVNTVGRSKYWNDTAIFVTWDDWGGWYDHVKPQQYNSYELGFRVPLLVISPYAKRGFVSHAQHEFGSILKFTEKTFDLGSLDATDVRSDDLSDCFDFSHAPAPFATISAPYGPTYFIAHANDAGSPDDD